MAYRQRLMERMDAGQDRVNASAPAEDEEPQPVRRPSPAMTDEQMRRYLAEVGARLALKDEHQASEIARGFSPGELPRDVEILLESLFE